ncbi:MAG: lysophospholipid acyltransferase family protein [Candidatus Kapaibacteriota bacterium]|jgi:putative hemolysin
MQNIDIKEIVLSKYPSLEAKFPKPIINLIIIFIGYFTKVNYINDFISKNRDKFNLDFIDELFETLDFSYYLTNKDKQKIPSEGRLIIVANHPLGALDGLTLLKAVSEVRKDVKIVANDVLQHITNLNDLFISIDIYSTKSYKKNVELIESALKKEEVLIFFPAAEVSRLSIKGILDKDWQRGAIKFAKKFNSPILPIFIQGKNSISFYLFSFLNKNFSSALLPREMFKQKSKSITLYVGNIIPASSINQSNLNERAEIKLLKKHTYLIGKNKPEIFKTEKNIIHPVAKKEIKFELLKSELLGVTKDNKKIYLCDYPNSENVLKEISRLRELTFRKVGEGTGKKYDLDIFDRYYKHIVLWDEDELEIVGSYRLGVTKELIEMGGKDYLYNSQLFEFSNQMDYFFENSLELGRSFVQQKYWGTNALDYLWQGIGAFLSKYNEIRYLIGAVSISGNYHEDAKHLIVAYYKKWYSLNCNSLDYNSENYNSVDFNNTNFILNVSSLSNNKIAKAKFPFEITEKHTNLVNSILVSDEHEKDLKYLKNALKNYGLTVPVLLRKYTDICEYGNVHFLDFGVDEAFGNSIDCYIVLDLHYLKSDFKKRYLFSNSFVKSKDLILN